MPDNAALRNLIARVGAFHITDKAMLAAQKAAEANGPTEAYVRAVRRYFEGFEREARGHLRDVDKRLEHANQVVFNLTAERGVAVKRIEATKSVLEELRKAWQ